MGGDHHHAPNPSAGPQFNNFRPPAIVRSQRRLAVAFGSIAWFWIYFRMYHDGPSLFGFTYHFGGSVDQKFDLDEFSFYEGDEELRPKF